MPRTPFQTSFTDPEGNLIAGPVTVTVTREDDATLPQLYPNFDNDDDPLGNPATFADGRVRLHADGGFYRIDAVGPNGWELDPPLRFVGIGLMQGQDFGLATLPAFAEDDAPDPDVVGAGAMIFVTDEVGGAVPAFSDGTDWRRVTDRAVISD